MPDAIVSVEIHDVKGHCLPTIYNHSPSKSLSCLDPLSSKFTFFPCLAQKNAISFTCGLSRPSAAMKNISCTSETSFQTSSPLSKSTDDIFERSHPKISRAGGSEGMGWSDYHRRPGTELCLFLDPLGKIDLQEPRIWRDPLCRSRETAVERMAWPERLAQVPASPGGKCSTSS